MSTEIRPPTAAIQARRRHLLAWYDRHGRDLPWRRHPSLYGTWIAETMLQQTTVAAVAGRWADFLRRFPDVCALAAAPQSEVLAAWSGLGYYRRARSLHEAARRLVADGTGALPRDPRQWRRLPGVGEYTAAAIASIGLGLEVPVVDVNVRRVLLRWTCAAAAAAAAVKPAHLRALAALHLAPGRPGDWNQALMDLGADICRVEAPACDRCPVRRWCAAGRTGRAGEVPPPAPRAAVRPVRLGVLVLRRADRVLMLPSEDAVVTATAGAGRPVRRTLAGLLGGLYSLPMTPWYAAATRTDDRHDRDGPSFLASWRRWLRGLGWPRPTVRAVGRHGHAITCHRLDIEVAAADWPHDLTAPAPRGSIWADVDHPPPLSTLTRRSLAAAAGSRP
jgi:A/G-specific adenine glycosylase